MCGLTFSANVGIMIKGYLIHLWSMTRRSAAECAAKPLRYGYVVTGPKRPFSRSNCRRRCCFKFTATAVRSGNLQAPTDASAASWLPQQAPVVVFVSSNLRVKDLRKVRETTECSCYMVLLLHDAKFLWENDLPWSCRWGKGCWCFCTTNITHTPHFQI
jgi:hypothetical protein